MGLVIILTKQPSNPTVSTLLRILKHEEKAEIYACGDGIYSILNTNSISNIIRNLLNKGCVIYVSKEDMKARGITPSLIIKGAKITENFYNLCVVNLMKNENTPLAI